MHDAELLSTGRMDPRVGSGRVQEKWPVDNSGMMADGCSLKLCIGFIPFSGDSWHIAKEINSIAWLFRDGSIRKCQFS